MYKLMLRELRKERGLRQEDMAKKLSVSLKVYGGWERGDTAIPLSAACDIATLLGCSLDDLAGRRTKMSLSPQEQAVVNALRQSKNMPDYPVSEKGIA